MRLQAEFVSGYKTDKRLAIEKVLGPGLTEHECSFDVFHIRGDSYVSTDSVVMLHVWSDDSRSLNNSRPLSSPALRNGDTFNPRYRLQIEWNNEPARRRTLCDWWSSLWK